MKVNVKWNIKNPTFMNVICRPRKNPMELQMAKKIAPGVSKYYCSLVPSTKVSYFIIKVKS